MQLSRLHGKHAHLSDGSAGTTSWAGTDASASRVPRPTGARVRSQELVVYALGVTSVPCAAKQRDPPTKRSGQESPQG